MVLAGVLAVPLIVLLGQVGLLGPASRDVPQGESQPIASKLDELLSVAVATFYDRDEAELMRGNVAAGDLDTLQAEIVARGGSCAVAPTVATCHIRERLDRDIDFFIVLDRGASTVQVLTTPVSR